MAAQSIVGEKTSGLTSFMTMAISTMNNLIH